MYPEKLVTFVVYERVLTENGEIKDKILATKYDEEEANILLSDAKKLKPNSIIRMRREEEIVYV